MKKHLLRILGFCFALAFVAASCSSGGNATKSSADGGDDKSSGSEKEGGTSNAAAPGEELKVCYITHAADGDSFWAVIEKGIAAAEPAANINVEYSGNNEVSDQANLLNDCVAGGDVDGVVVSLSNPEGMETAVKDVADQGIPIVTVNAGQDAYPELVSSGAIIGHVGQPEELAGEGAGNALNDAGVTGKVLCVKHEAASVTLDSRCKGLAATYGGTVEELDVSSTGTAEISGTQDTIQNTLETQSDVAAVMALNPDVAGAANQAIKDSGSEAKLATFDLGEAVLDGVEAGEILFAIDQQPYVQGYMPLVMIRLFKENLNLLGGGQAVASGPSTVTADNVAEVKKLIEEGTR